MGEYPPIEVTLVGIVIFVIDEHPGKAKSPIKVICIKQSGPSLLKIFCYNFIII